jgi:hypothetical protein
MDQFFSSNPGMGSRIAHHVDFPDYDLDSLVAIARIMLDKQRYTFSPDAEPAFRELMSRRMTQPRFANARSVRNALERARLRQANRLVSEAKLVTREDLMRIDAADILKSRWFTEAPDSPAFDGRALPAR